MTGGKLGILLSGSGRSLENLCERIADGSLRAEIAVVVSSSARAPGVERARRRGIPVQVVDKAAAGTPEAASERIFAILDSARVDLCVLAGFLRILPVPARWLGRAINIHPALLPAFGGPGMWGHHVHEAVLRSGARVSGCTVHYVTNEVDAGPIVEQRAVPVEDGDDADALAARVFEEEKRALPLAIALHLDRKLVIRGQRVVRLP